MLKGQEEGQKKGSSKMKNEKGSEQKRVGGGGQAG